MCGKAPPFRSSVLTTFAAARLSLAAARKRESQLAGKPEAFRTSGGQAAPQLPSQIKPDTPMSRLTSEVARYFAEIPKCSDDLQIVAASFFPLTCLL